LHKVKGLQDITKVICSHKSHVGCPKDQ